MIKFNKVSTYILSGLGGLIGAQGRRRDRNGCWQELGGLLSNLDSSQQGERLEFWDRVRTADGEPSAALERIGSLERQAGVGERELTWRGGRRRSPQPFRFPVFPAPTWAAGLGKGAGEREGRSGAEGVEEGGDRRK